MYTYAEKSKNKRYTAIPKLTAAKHTIQMNPKPEDKK